MIMCSVFYEYMLDYYREQYFSLSICFTDDKCCCFEAL